MVTMSNFRCLLVAVLLGYAVAAVDVGVVLKNVPKEDLTDFIEYYAKIGYELSSGNTEILKDKSNSVGIADLDSTSEFAVSLYKWLINNYRFNPRARSFHRSVICFPSGQCINIGDVGVHP